MTDLSMQDRQWILDQFKGEECQCGRAKKPNHAFCYHCYTSLPRHMQQDLWQPFGRGFEAAYEEAVQWLN